MFWNNATLNMVLLAGLAVMAVVGSALYEHFRPQKKK